MIAACTLLNTCIQKSYQSLVDLCKWDFDVGLAFECLNLCSINLLRTFVDGNIVN